MKEKIVIKCGGSILDSLSDSFFASIQQLKEQGKEPIVVHGGGPAINEMLELKGVESTFVNGLRKTTKDVLDVAEMVLCGKVNKQLVSKLQLAGLPTVGLSGCDGQLITVEPVDSEGLGYVGEPTAVNDNLLLTMLEQGYVPVIAPIGVGDDGAHYNINADSAAAAIASAIGAVELMFVTDVPGILKQGEVIEKLTTADVEQLMKDGTIHGGMIPKVKAAVASLTNELHSVLIVDGRQAFLKEEGKFTGTIIQKDPVTTEAL
ncbi:acetylglutamate kinase [Halalkalibacterium ligniniphilum]|uniref:acetylglutamate kinase n=1 Tax=Halalkalibacterium ligniniphilum TaxID=1134413 RepID=UPI00034CB31A|nr:acetylglutamate kinase [Halalkalibacterium ligniniphilum]